jgi:phosphoserine phosphatase
MNKDIVLIDICGTLYNSNTTFDFLDYSFLNNNKYLLFRKCTKFVVWKIINKISLILFKFDLTRTFAVRFLKNKTKAELEAAVDLFYENVLKKLSQKEVFELIDKLKSEEKRLILVSATLDFIATKVSSEIGIFECYSTVLEYENDICKGKIKQDLLSRKFSFLNSVDIFPPFSHTITDNFSDLDLLKNSDEMMIVSVIENHVKWYSVLKRNNITNFKIITV